MRCPTLAELPPPPAGRSGWPWTEETPRRAGDPALAPRITIVTPSYMQGEFLEETIRSVLLQGYPDLEYFILDGGSTDGSREIIGKYEPWLAGWRCARDGGQPAAVNEGWARATGEIVAWINSDDWYLPGAFATIASAFENGKTAWVSGAVDDCDQHGKLLKRHPAAPTPFANCLTRRNYGYFQPGMFWRRALLQRVGPLDTDLEYGFDHEFWIRSLLAGYEMAALPEPLVCFRLHLGSKSGVLFHRQMRDDWEIFRRYRQHLPAEERGRAASALRDYEAEYFIPAIYRMLLAGRRGQALWCMLRSFRLIPHLRPPQVWLGALLRTVFTGRPPAWFAR